MFIHAAFHYLETFYFNRCFGVKFSSRLNRHPGETGAGKSILIDAVQLALGSKVSIDIIQPGHDRAEITLIFDLKNLILARKWLKDMILKMMTSVSSAEPSQRRKKPLLY